VRDPSQPSVVSETQLGAIGENLVANHLVMASAGRLSPFRPVADDGGIDVLIYDKVTGQALPLQVKCRTRTLARHPKIVHFQVRKATFVEHHHGHVLCVYFNRATLAISRAWLIPMRTFLSVAFEQTDDYRVRPSIDMSSADRYTPFRCTDLGEVAERLITYFDALPPHC
jgi:hypothetical protein